ncbi:phospholipid carrier-dependent glycosyltransferase [Candidatus Parcubacteria bacterium]|nr:MAG: phospholipid carrier-dependent glycosyltransferase [Candidatus Parcubacteria bacterium]
MYMKLKNKLNLNKCFTIVLLLVIVLLASLVRVYKIDQIPPALSWDEASVGYNAWTIANFGKDEWGKSFPLVFKAFGEDKHPVHIYITTVFVKLMGLSELSTRFSAALFGVLNVTLLFFLGKIFFKSNLAGLIAAFLLAISPYNIHFSRFNHELNFALFFFLLGSVCFFQGINKKPILVTIAFLSFGIDLLTYPSAKIITPPLIFLITMLYFKKLLNIRPYFLFGVLIWFSFIILMILNPGLIGRERINQTSFGMERISSTSLYQKTQNPLLGRMEIIFNQYFLHYSPRYLAISGDKNPMLSSQITGEFYILDILFLIIGLIALGIRRSKEGLVLLVWGILGPIPSSLVNEAPHAARAMFMLGSWHLITAFGFYTLISIFKKTNLKILVVFIGVIMYSFLFKNYVVGYFGEYAKRYAIEWQYGMKQAIEYIKEHDRYFQVYVTAERGQPYIFFAYYLQTPLPGYLDTVYYNENENRSFNLVSFFDKYHFGDWNPIESFPHPGVLYMLTPSEYDGLRHRDVFDVKKLIKYPNGLDAFYLVSYL